MKYNYIGIIQFEISLSKLQLTHNNIQRNTFLQWNSNKISKLLQPYKETKPNKFMCLAEETNNKSKSEIKHVEDIRLSYMISFHTYFIV